MPISLWSETWAGGLFLTLESHLKQGITSPVVPFSMFSNL